VQGVDGKPGVARGVVGVAQHDAAAEDRHGRVDAGRLLVLIDVIVAVAAGVLDCLDADGRLEGYRAPEVQHPTPAQ